MARKRVTIVFEETDTNSVHDGQGFNVFIEGVEGTEGKPEMAWTAAEFWGLKCLNIIVDVMRRAGALKTVVKKGGS